MKHQRRMRDAAVKDTTKISAPVPKSDVAFAENTTKHSKGTAQYSKQKQKIVQDQAKERIPRVQATLKFLRLNPNPELIFSNAVKNTSNRTASKFPSGSEQENQSEFNENYSPTAPAYDMDTVLWEMVKIKGGSPPNHQLQAAQQ